jgi:hypothetical protein
MSILEERIAEARVGGRTGSFAIRPAIVRPGDAVIDFLERVLANVIDEHARRAWLEGERVGISQAHGPDRPVVAA